MSFKLVRCADIIDVRDGTHDSPKYQNQGYPLITSKNINNNKIDFSTVNFISEEDYNKINSRSQVDNGDILMPMIGTVGNPVLVDTKQKFAIKNVALFKLSNNEVVMGKYFYYLLCSDIVKKQLEKSKRGGTQNFVSLKNLRDLRIPIVELNKQEKIVTILDKSYELIKIRKKQLELLNELVKSRFVEMFGDPVKNVMQWEKILCKEATLKIGSGATPKGGNSSYKDEGISLIRSMNVYNNNFVENNLAYIDDEQAEKLKNVEVKRNDVLLNITGASVARCCIVPPKYIPARVNQHVSILRCEDTKILPIFLCYQFTNENYQRLLWEIASNSGATREAITKQQIENLEVIIPPIELQNQFADFVTKVDKLKFEMERSLKKLEDNFNSLMQKAFKGELF